LFNAGIVYDVTDFLDQHMGSAYLDYLGMDVSRIWGHPEIHQHTTTATDLLELYRIGTLSE